MRRMPRSYKICSPFVPGVGGHDTVAGAVSDQLAANERVDNTRVVPLRRGADMRLRAAVEKFKLWENGRTLRVKFLDGVPEVQDKVAAIAKEWEDVANLTLDFVTGRRRRDPHQLRREGLLVVDRRHRRPDRAGAPRRR